MVISERILNEAVAAFEFGAPVVSVCRFGSGHVNDTFRVDTDRADGENPLFILQRINEVAFHKPDEVMANVIGITEYLSKKIREAGGDPSREALQVIRPRSGEISYKDSEGGTWRVFPFVRDIECYDSAETPELFEASARAFGKFQRMLDGYPAETLYETIPHFHDTEDRLARLKAAIAADSMGRVAECADEISFALAREADCSVALNALREGVLPLRVTHNDTKLNNVLIDKVSGDGICIVDLDTTMPGLSIYDFGDSIRFGANHADEDEKDLTKVNFDIDLFEAYTRGFLEGAGGALTQAELEHLPWGAKLMTLECGMRFLTDYLVGDVYFQISRPEQNLDRCRTQFKLVRDMEAQLEAMGHIVAKCASRDKE